MKNVREREREDPKTGKKYIETLFEAKLLSIDNNVVVSKSSNSLNYRLGKIDFQGINATSMIFEESWAYAERSINMFVTISPREGIVKGEPAMIFTLVSSGKDKNLSIEEEVKNNLYYMVHSFEGATMSLTNQRVTSYELIHVEPEELIINGQHISTNYIQKSDLIYFAVVENSEIDSIIRSKFNTPEPALIDLNKFTWHGGVINSFYHEDILLVKRNR